MKRLFCTIAAILILSALGVPALAAVKAYPTDVQRSEDGMEIRKVYELEEGEDPEKIPQADFEQGGVAYTLTDILRQELSVTEHRECTDTVTLESNTKDTEKVLALLPTTKDYTSEDGFTGVLTLNTASITVEAAGQGFSSRTVTASRSYPNLSSADTQYIPKTIQENGRTLTLQNVDWQTDNTANVEGYQMADRYTAVATYTGTATSSYVTGYLVTAEYTGELSKSTMGKVRYTAIFAGIPVEPVVEAPPTPLIANWVYLACAALVGVLLLAGIILGLRNSKKKKECRENETNPDNDTIDTVPGEPVDFPGVGPGV